MKRDPVFGKMVVNFPAFNKSESTIPGQFWGRLPRSMVGCLLVFTICTLFLQSCAVTGEVLAKLPLSAQDSGSIDNNYFLVAEKDDVLGRLATIRIGKGEALPDIARHFSLGINTLSAANPGVDVWVPRARERIVLPSSFILPEGGREGIVINLAAMRLFYFKKEGNQRAVATFPVGVGTAERPTPKGLMYITRKRFRPTWYVPASIAADHRKKGDPLPATVPPGPLNPLGEHALYLSESGYLIHGTNKPASIGLRATNGCIRLYPEDIKRLSDITPVKTPVRIVNQPFLIGRREGVIYLEAHKPFEKSGAAAELKKIFAKLKRIEKDDNHNLDWPKVEKILAETRGIPAVISTIGAGRETGVDEIIKLRHPIQLHGQPQVPEYRSDAWYVLAASVDDKVEARRLAAILNHQGPPIPARVRSEGGRHRVLAGPFVDKAEARDASKRLKIDLAMDGALVAPVKSR